MRNETQTEPFQVFTQRHQGRLRYRDTDSGISLIAYYSSYRAGGSHDALRVCGQGVREFSIRGCLHWLL